MHRYALFVVVEASHMICHNRPDTQGLGFGLIYLPAIVSVSMYFEKKRAFATGIAVCGSGLGTFLMAPLVHELIDRHGWENAFVITGAIVLLCVFLGALFRPIPNDDSDGDSGVEAEGQITVEDVGGRAADIPGISQRNSAARLDTEEGRRLMAEMDGGVRSGGIPVRSSFRFHFQACLSRVLHLFHIPCVLGTSAEWGKSSSTCGSDERRSHYRDGQSWAILQRGSHGTEPPGDIAVQCQQPVQELGTAVRLPLEDLRERRRHRQTRTEQRALGQGREQEGVQRPRSPLPEGYILPWKPLQHPRIQVRTRSSCRIIDIMIKVGFYFNMQTLLL